MQIKQFTFNPFQENTYLLINDQKECIIIDPGCLFVEEKEKLANYITNNGLTLKRLIVTHLHLDHSFGIHFISEKFGVKAEASQKDEFLLADMKKQASLFGLCDDVEGGELGGYLKEGDIIQLGEIELHVREVPGHSPGGLLYYAPKNGFAFVGDTIFQGSIGRTDLAGGSYSELIKNIHEKIMLLPPETVLYAGHGPRTTVDKELESNPYC
ncbi:MAG TPA: MBL fold metallo-hydrolase [Paludibacteraceae bacterium]|nr:MBL fold metallo-hydrolase [Paludibacteraceae bacterium]HOU69291.1 MBL fold metallo-hydrolase [Paludibacteraceae bacterium]HPH62901.1 MBL fold metallo-hydrolase [Paludibacteraceae bacterium]HQF51036.1 MBL fold metallo-hydrolase [Paludibacteraceae bacterium]